ncbi:hypothetical protein CANINC_004901 [Pichia inconspicua]|uniref:RING-type domain-containing protein n=1 Tax=Pichia inconspicua TaxID=52247 RepID=A0A4T0WUT6_9ASCO|nr:hypothetical protein CANINC_004901 [[Candida] inconspicua]
MTVIEDVAEKVLNGEIADFEELSEMRLVKESEQTNPEIKEDESIGESLEKIGVTIPSFLIPNVDILKPSVYSKRINDYLIQSVSMETSPSSKIKDALSDMINRRTSELKSLYSEVSESLKGIVNTNIEHPIDDFLEEESSNLDNENTETEEMIRLQKIQQEEALMILRKYDHLTVLSFEQFQDQQFLRSRIREILKLDIQPVLQRILIQKLMSHSYLEKQNYIRQNLYSGDQVVNAAVATAGDPGASSSFILNNEDYNNDNNDNNDSEDNAEDDDEVLLSSEDRKPTYFSESEKILGCKHYQRNCKVECLTCHKWYTCRLCHDEVVGTHKLDANKIKYMLCMHCFTPQYPSQFCIECDKEMSAYFCSVCKLFDNDTTKNIYHCDKCGICRLGLGLNQDYFHCDSCNACISIELRTKHVCIENSTKSNCPICDEFMFSSNEKVVFMNCGHPIHENCYNKHTQHSYKCPTCSKTITNMELQFRMRDAEIKQSEMPDEMRDWKVEIKCNDCGGMSRVSFHYLGHKCDHCHSYNTMQLKLIKGFTERNALNLSDENVDEKLYVAEQFITDSLKQNFEFDHEITKTDENKKKTKFSEEDHSISHDYVENFVKVINNFEAYSSISDAFKDWISESMNSDFFEES